MTVDRGAVVLVKLDPTDGHEEPAFDGAPR